MRTAAADMERSYGEIADDYSPSRGGYGHR